MTGLCGRPWWPLFERGAPLALPDGSSATAVTVGTPEWRVRKFSVDEDVVKAEHKQDRTQPQRYRRGPNCPHLLRYL